MKKCFLQMAVISYYFHIKNHRIRVLKSDFFYIITQGRMVLAPNRSEPLTCNATIGNFNFGNTFCSTSWLSKWKFSCAEFSNSSVNCTLHSYSLLVAELKKYMLERNWRGWIDLVEQGFQTHGLRPPRGLQRSG